MVEVLPSGIRVVPVLGTRTLVNPPFLRVKCGNVPKLEPQLWFLNYFGGDLRITELRFCVCERVRNMDLPEFTMRISHNKIRNFQLLMGQYKTTLGGHFLCYIW